MIMLLYKKFFMLWATNILSRNKLAGKKTRYPNRKLAILQLNLFIYDYIFVTVTWGYLHQKEVTCINIKIIRETKKLCQYFTGFLNDVMCNKLCTGKNLFTCDINRKFDVSVYDLIITDNICTKIYQRFQKIKQE